MDKYLNGGFQDNHSLLQQVQHLGWAGIRDGVSLKDPSTQMEMQLAAASVKAAGMKFLGIVWEPAQITWFGRDVLIEVGNEPNIGTDLKMTPAQYADVAGACIEECDRLHVPCYIGSISNLTPDPLDYLADVIRRLPAQKDWRVSIHVYPQGDEPTTRYPESLAALKTVIGSRKFAVTETGLWTAPRYDVFRLFGWTLFKYNRRVWTDEQVAQAAQQIFQFWDQAGADFVAWYAINDGPRFETEKEDSFGIRRYNLDNPHDWKSVAYQNMGS